MIHYNPIQTSLEDISVHTIKDEQQSNVVSPLQIDSTNVDSSMLETATLRSTYVNITVTLIGAGILSLPYAFSKTGFVLAIVLLIASCIVSYLSSYLLTTCAIKTTLPSSFSTLSREAGISNLSLFVDAAVLMKCVGVATSYPVVIGGLMPAAVRHFSISSSSILLHRQFWIMVSFFICSPLCFLRSFDSLKWTSSMSMILAVLLTLLMFSYMMRLFHLNPCQPSLHSSVCQTDQVAFITSFETIKVLPLFCFVFTCQHNTFAVVNELISPTKQRVSKVFFYAVISALVLYLIIGLSSYMTYGSAVLSNALKSYPDSSLTSTARILVSIIIGFHYPLQCNPGRKCAMSIWKSFTGNTEPKLQEYNFRYIVITTVFVAFTFTMAMLLENLGTIFSIVGATGSTCVTYVFPGIYYYRLHKNDVHDWKYYYSIFQFSFGIVMMITTLSFILIGVGNKE